MQGGGHCVKNGCGLEVGRSRGLNVVKASYGAFLPFFMEKMTFQANWCVF